VPTSGSGGCIDIFGSQLAGLVSWVRSLVARLRQILRGGEGTAPSGARLAVVSIAGTVVIVNAVLLGVLGTHLADSGHSAPSVPARPHTQPEAGLPTSGPATTIVSAAVGPGGAAGTPAGGLPRRGSVGILGQTIRSGTTTTTSTTGAATTTATTAPGAPGLSPLVFSSTTLTSSTLQANPSPVTPLSESSYPVVLVLPVVVLGVAALGWRRYHRGRSEVSKP
jgi:hypothetical protein